MNDVPWPGSAATHVCLTWTVKGPWLGEHWLDGRKVDAISDSLSDSPQLSEYYTLKANDKIAFRGAMPYGEGFFIQQAEANELLRKNPENSHALVPYLIGDDINSDPLHRASRYIVNFHDWPLRRDSSAGATKAAEDFPELLKIVEERVKPQRLALPENNSTAKHRRKFWWQFSNRADDLLEAIGGKERALAISRTTAHLAFAFVPAQGIVHSERLVVVADESWSMFGVLQSTLHEAWASRPGMMTHETRLTYFVKEVFCTYPRPNTTRPLEHHAEEYYQHRASVLEARQEGFTSVYNRFHDHGESSPDIIRLRDLHTEMDKAVAAAYGWSDFDLGHGFHETKQGIRFTITEAARREVLARLLKLNHERYAEEVAQGLHDKKRGAGSVGRGAKKTGSRAKKGKGSSEPSLFGEEP